MAITALSLWWTTIKARRILGESLGRKLRKGEETSLTSWMQAPDASLEIAAHELERNPFERLLRMLAKLGIWKGDVGTAPEDHTLLRTVPVGRRVVLIDDVLTTGNHVRAAAAFLESRGATIACALCAGRSGDGLTIGDAFAVRTDSLESFAAPLNRPARWTA